MNERPKTAPPVGSSVLLAAVVAHYDAEAGRPMLEAPGHCHIVKGHWDRDGSVCKWCTTWTAVRKCVAANAELSHGREHDDERKTP